MSQYVKNSENTQKRGKGFQKGNTLGHGRPKTARCIPETLREIGGRLVDAVLLAKLHAKYGPAHNPKTLHEAMLMAAAKDAAQGDEHARSFIAERTEGKVTDEIKLDSEQTINHQHSFDFSKLGTDDIIRFREIVAKGLNKEPALDKAKSRINREVLA